MARITTIESIDAPYRCACSNGIHTWYADEPEYNHGGNTGPSPGELLLSAVGTCATITLRMYAARKEWPVDKIKIELRLEEVKTESGVLNKIHEALTVEGDLDEEQYARLKSLLPKCPVAKIVTGQVEIVY
ncbi:MAG: OsmC family protein [Saprospiraceae bacterium]|nr:OsmC family protein [Saprospiraceae bacterium]